SGAQGNAVAGNNIGTNASGTAAVANLGGGILLVNGAQSNLIGTDGSNDAFNAAERNLVSGNVANGIRIGLSAADSGTRLNVVAGNYIGTDVTGTRALGNSSFGVRVSGGANANRIGTDGNGIADGAEGN